ncbi:hypothetical protein HDV04_003140 [Boothiomyces sp. JEL0838]|nr:hypothetical protein HDV04_003140 [Boothiomyces sp. JEL0838]
MKFEIFATIAAVFAQGSSSTTTGTAQPQTALDVVLGSSVHTTLAKLAGSIPAVVSVLKSSGPLTLFAPTDDAFKKLSADTLAAVQSDTSLLTSILTYHVIPGVAYDPLKVTAKDTFAVTAQGETIEAVKSSSGVTLEFGYSTLSTVTASVPTTNGIVHVVDTVLIPPTSASKTATAAGLSSLVNALVQVGLVDTLDSAQNITIFAPVNSAFDKLTAFAKANGLNITNEILTTVLKSHVIPSVIYSSDIVAAGKPVTVKALSGAPITAVYQNGSVLISGAGNSSPATVSVADVLIDHGVVHVIDQVLLPALNATNATATSTTAAATTTAATMNSATSPSLLGVFSTFVFLLL